MARTYSQTPDPHYAQRAKDWDGEAALTARVAALEAGVTVLSTQYLHSIELTIQGSDGYQFNIMFTNTSSEAITRVQNLPYGKYFVGQTQNGKDVAFSNIAGFHVFSTAQGKVYQCIYAEYHDGDSNLYFSYQDFEVTDFTAINDTVTQL